MRTVGTLAAAVALAAGLAACASGVTPQQQHLAHMDSGRVAPCVLPPISKPRAGIENGGLIGPAVSSLRGGPALQPFSLDGGAFAVSPPPAGTVPAVSLQEAECEALASSGSSGGFVEAASSTGVAAGYGMVAISPAVKENPVDEQQTFGQGSPPLSLPPAAAYSRRLAWALVFEQFLSSSCPSFSVGTAATDTTVPQAEVGYHYAIFLVDASTGRDGVVYNEAQPPSCPGTSPSKPFLYVPYEQTSVPWTLVSRDPNGYSAQLRAEVPRCDSYENPVNVQRGTDTVQILAFGVIGVGCPTVAVNITLEAEDVFSELPPRLVHAPVGLDAGGTPVSPASADHPSKGELVNVGLEANGGTITVRVGDVVGVELLRSEDPMHPYDHFSSNPAVLGLLGFPGEPLSEFRAWKPGSATLRVPQANWSLEVVVVPR